MKNLLYTGNLSPARKRFMTDSSHALILAKILSSIFLNDQDYK